MSRMRIIQVSALVLSALCGLAVMQLRLQAWDQQPFRVHVIDYPRPVSAAVLEVEKHFRWVVTYEDTRYVHSSDIVDVTEQFRRGGNRPTRVLQMRNGNIDVTFLPPPGASIEARVGQVLQQIVQQSNAAGNTGEFRVDWVRGGYHVVPVAMKGKTGAIEPYTSILDTRITLPYQEENGLEMMSRITQALTKGSGVTVSRGTMPLGVMERARVALDAQNDPARDILWRALCGVGESGGCSINIHPVPKK